MLKVDEPVLAEVVKGKTRFVRTGSDDVATLILVSFGMAFFYIHTSFTTPVTE